MQTSDEITKNTILVTGATGKLGAAVIQQLLKKIPPSQIVAFARDEHKAASLKRDGVEVRLGDFDDSTSLEHAMRGIQTVLLVSGANLERVVLQHKNVVNASKRAGVQTIAYTSRSLKNREELESHLMATHFETEDDIQESGLPYIIFRNSLYMDTIPFLVGPQFDKGISIPAGMGKVAYALRSEQGEAIANVLAAHGETNKIYSFTGSRAWSFADVATALGELSGKKVTYTPGEKFAFEEQLKAQGVPEPIIQNMTAFMSDIEHGQEEEVAPDLEMWLGRKPASLEEGLKLLFNL